MGRQAILDVAVKSVDGQSRASDEASDRPLQVRHEQKISKYGLLAGQNNKTFTPAVLSNTGQTHGEFIQEVS